MKTNRHFAWIAALCCCFLIANSPAKAQITSKAQWDSAFQKRYPDGDPLLEITNGDEDGKFSWHAHYWIRAYVSMAATFNDTVYLDKAVKLIDHILYYRDDARDARGEIDIRATPYLSAPLYYLHHRNEAAPGWRNREHRHSWRIHVLFDGQITHAIMRFVDLVLSRADFSAYHPKARAYLSKVEETVNAHNSLFVFDRFPDVPGSYYYPNPDGSGLYRGTVPFNHNATMGVTLLLLDKVKGGVPQYRQKARAILDFFKHYAITTPDSAYFWEYNFRAKNPVAEDFNHAHIDLSFFVTAYYCGLNFSETDMLRFANTLTKKIYRDGELSWFIDGTNDPSKNSYWPIGFDWLDLAEFDPAIFVIAEAYYQKNYPSPNWARPFLGWAELLRWNRILQLKKE